MQRHQGSRRADCIGSACDAFALPLEQARQQLAPETELVLNEVVLGVDDWCDVGSAKKGHACPQWHSKLSASRAANRKMLGWNHDATVYAYNFARLFELGYLYVTSDQLVGGPWPDNYPSISSLDWEMGEPNAKYRTARLLAAVLGTNTRQLMATSVSSLDISTNGTSTAHAVGFVQGGQKGILLLSKGPGAVTFSRSRPGGRAYSWRAWAKSRASHRRARSAWPRRRRRRQRSPSARMRSSRCGALRCSGPS